MTAPGPALDASDLDARVGFASDLSTTLVIEGVCWDGRRGPFVIRIER